MTEQTTKRAQTTTDYERLVRFLISPGPTFGFAIARYADPRVRDRLIEQATRDAQAAGLRAETLNLSRTKLEGHPNLADLLEQRLRPKKNEEAIRAVFIVQLEKFLIDPFGETRVSPSISVLNQSRDLLPRRMGARVVLWLTDAAANTFATFAHDLYDVALTHFRFEDRDDPMPITQYGNNIPDWLVAATDEDRPRLKREVSLLETIFRSATSIPSKADAAFRIAQIHAILSEPIEAKKWFGIALELYHEANDILSEGKTLLRYGDFLYWWNELDTALGYFENALTVYHGLNDERMIAESNDRIADILQARSYFDIVLEIRQNQILPVLQKLGDIKNEAITRGKIADILQAQGQLKEALEIRQNHEIPVYQKLGNLRSEAVVRGKIASILQAGGQFDEALEIRREMELPIYTKLGDKYSIMLVCVKIAVLMYERGRPEDMSEITSLLRTALQAAQEMRVDAEYVENIMQDFGISQN
jgi:tetratricopeptide (TPR) repeat protein